MSNDINLSIVTAMKYCLSVDWLAVYCFWSGNSKGWDGVSGNAGTISAAYPWRYRLADFDTRQFDRLTYVSMPNEQGGWDDFAEVQTSPHSMILNQRSVIVRFVNRVLYRADFWELASKFLADNSFTFQSISRIDICADFNDFKTMSPKTLIEGFANKIYRHVGRGVGALYFNHGIFANKKTGTRDYGVNYTGLSFGTHASDARVYLYNKSFELLTQGDKPWIRDRWRAIGLDVTSVWRLEVSIKAKARIFKDRLSGAKIEINMDNAADTDGELSTIYHSFVAKLFAFVRNRPGITNITREPRLQLFSLHPIYVRHSIRNVSGGDRLDKMIIKALYTLSDTYRGKEHIVNQDLAQSFALGIAESTDLIGWMKQKHESWKRPTHK